MGSQKTQQQQPEINNLSQSYYYLLTIYYSQKWLECVLSHNVLWIHLWIRGSASSSIRVWTPWALLGLCPSWIYAMSNTPIAEPQLKAPVKTQREHIETETEKFWTLTVPMAVRWRPNLPREDLGHPVLPTELRLPLQPLFHSSQHAASLRHGQPKKRKKKVG